jgi:ADP-ribose pyrophosphatase YjhB (NUDIX family)
MARNPRFPLHAAGLLERSDNQILIVKMPQDENGEALWQFPRGPVKPGESAEVAMRRMALEQLGMHVEIVVGQPPIRGVVKGQSVELRYFFCGVVEEESRPGTYAETRWVAKGQLREYDFDEASRPVAEWLVDD